MHGHAGMDGGKPTDCSVLLSRPPQFCSSSVPLCSSWDLARGTARTQSYQGFAGVFRVPFLLFLLFSQNYMRIYISVFPRAKSFGFHEEQEEQRVRIARQPLQTPASFCSSSFFQEERTRNKREQPFSHLTCRGICASRCTETDGGKPTDCSVLLPRRTQRAAIGLDYA